jgi:cytochrome c2
MLRSLLAAAAVLVSSPALAQSGGDAAAGAGLFQTVCGSCHSTEPGKNGFGPSLAHVVGRKAASAPDFQYTPALTAWGKVLTPETLDAFLAAPTDVVPGTAMAIPIVDAKSRADLIAYLKTQ